MATLDFSKKKSDPKLRQNFDVSSVAPRYPLPNIARIWLDRTQLSKSAKCLAALMCGGGGYGPPK